MKYYQLKFELVFGGLTVMNKLFTGVSLVLFATTVQALAAQRTMGAWPSRPYELHIPESITSPAPLVLAIHGGGGNAKSMARLTCPDGDITNPKCLDKLSDREGFVVVYPNGSYNPQLCDLNPSYCGLRTFNAGGGLGGFNCASGYACEVGIDDIGYFRDLIGDVQKVAKIDPKKIYAAGISNGGAMAHRLACELSDRIAAIASVSAGNQFSTEGGCSDSIPMPILEIHGDGDSIWPYDGGYSSLATAIGWMISTQRTLGGWLSRNNCSLTPDSSEWLPHQFPADETRVRKDIYRLGCAPNEVVHYFVANGGHRWPDGWDYPSVNDLGPTTRDLNANEVIWSFFRDKRIR